MKCVVFESLCLVVHVSRWCGGGGVSLFAPGDATTTKTHLDCIHSFIRRWFVRSIRLTVTTVELFGCSLFWDYCISITSLYDGLLVYVVCVCDAHACDIYYYLPWICLSCLCAFFFPVPAAEGDLVTYTRIGDFWLRYALYTTTVPSFTIFNFKYNFKYYL